MNRNHHYYHINMAYKQTNNIEILKNKILTSCSKNSILLPIMIITIDLKEHDSSLKKKLTYTFNPGHYHHHQTIIGIKQSSIMSHFRAKNLTTSAYIYLKVKLTDKKQQTSSSCESCF
ncbi:hypothetical protein DERF_004290 [Dermatophagoides farinae]|uniref:Uncharacterized protein n=1 Tax=Dermatophagoides farinae TaxID=6954 RepID=A0A922I3L7_DERFA|nr:hypothetical protein DERF_004290 [Dermatophagoides farinae]